VVWSDIDFQSFPEGVQFSEQNAPEDSLHERPVIHFRVSLKCSIRWVCKLKSRSSYQIIGSSLINAV
jgi:hypothetical protein